MQSFRTSAKSIRRCWAFRILAVVLGIAPFLALEWGLWALDLPETDPEVDPFVGFSSIRPLFELNAEGDQYRIAPSRRKFFADDSFPAHKPDAGFRCFVLGESTVQGNPYSIQTSFTTWLEIALRTADPDRDWKIVNCGGVSYASYRLVPILVECLNYEPDLIIICSGHNEFLEDRTYGHVRRVPTALHLPIQELADLRCVACIRELLRHHRTEKPVLRTETDPMLDYRHGLEAFHRDSAWAASVATHYESNLRRMVTLARRAGVPVILVRPCSNLADCPPFKTAPNPDLTPDARRRREHLLEKFRGTPGITPLAGTELLREILNLDPLDAKAWYDLGCLELIQGHADAAREALVRARDLDVCPLRMTSPLEAALDRVAGEFDVPMINAHAILEAESDQHILGDFWLVDHVHPSIEGHQKIALALAEEMKRRRIVSWSESLGEMTKLPFAEHLASLDRSYFHEGRRKLQVLREWTRGNVDGPPVEQRFPHRIRPSASGDSPAPTD